MIEEKILEKLRYLPRVQQNEVLDFIEFLAAKLARSATRQEQMAAAAKTLLAEYEADVELTAFTALDSEDFHAEG